MNSWVEWSNIIYTTQNGQLLHCDNHDNLGIELDLMLVLNYYLDLEGSLLVPYLLHHKP